MTWQLTAACQGTVAAPVDLLAEGFTEESATAGIAVYTAGARPGAPAGQTTHIQVTGRKALRKRITVDSPYPPLFPDGDGGVAGWFFLEGAAGTPPAATAFVRFRDATGALVGAVTMNTARKVRLINAAGDASDIWDTALAVDTWYALGMPVEDGGGSFSVTIWNGTTGDVAADLTGDLTNLVITELEFGVLVDSGSSTWSIGFDDLAAGDSQQVVDLPPVCYSMLPGAPTRTSLTVTTHTEHTDDVNLVVTRVSDDIVVAITDRVQPATNGHATHFVPGLAPGTEYAITVQGRTADGTVLDVETGAARTTPDVVGDWVYKIAFGSCQQTVQEDGTNNLPNSWEAIEAALADLIVILGDSHYKNVEANKSKMHMVALEDQWIRATYMAEATRNAATHVMRSDHDGGGPNNAQTGGQAWTLASQEALSKFAPHYDMPLFDAGAMYQTMVIGGVIKVIWTDFRNYERSDSDAIPADNAGKTALGPTQKALFFADIQAWGGPILWMTDDIWQRSIEAPDVGRTAGEHTNKYDTMASYQAEQDEIAALLEPIKHRVLRVNGDAHALTADDGTSNPQGGFPQVGAAGTRAGSNPRAGNCYQQYFPDPALGGTLDLSHWGLLTLERTGNTIAWHFEGFNELDGVDGAMAGDIVVDLEGTWDVTGFTAPASRPLFHVDGYDINRENGPFRLDAASQIHRLPSKIVPVAHLPGLNGRQTSRVDLDGLDVPVLLQVRSLTEAGLYGGPAEFSRQAKTILGLFNGKDRRLIGWGPPGAESIEWELRARIIAAVGIDQKGAEFGKLPLLLDSDGWAWRSPENVIYFRRFGNDFPGARLHPLDGSNAPMTDALIKIKGPVNRFDITDDKSGSYFSWGDDDLCPVLEVGEYLKIDCDHFTAYIDTTSGWTVSEDAVDVSPFLDWGSDGNHMLELTPYPIDGLYDWGVTVTANLAGGDSAESEIEIKVKRAAVI